MPNHQMTPGQENFDVLVRATVELATEQLSVLEFSGRLKFIRLCRDFVDEKLRLEDVEGRLSLDYLDYLDHTFAWIDSVISDAERDPRVAQAKAALEAEATDEEEETVWRRMVDTVPFVMLASIALGGYTVYRLWDLSRGFAIATIVCTVLLFFSGRALQDERDSGVSGFTANVGLNFLLTIYVIVAFILSFIIK